MKTEPIAPPPGLADAIPFPDASFDAAVASPVPCSVRDARRALAELFRVVRPGVRRRADSVYRLGLCA